jgi:hypothetical protein
MPANLIYYVQIMKGFAKFLISFSTSWIVAFLFFTTGLVPFIGKIVNYLFHGYTFEIWIDLFLILLISFLISKFIKTSIKIFILAQVVFLITTFPVMTAVFNGIAEGIGQNM